MNTGTLIRLLGWTSLTYLWLEANRLFFNAIIDESENESEDESGNEGDNESESEDK